MRRIILCSGLLCFGALAADQGLQAVFDRMDKASATFKGFTSDLTKVDHQDFVNATDTSTGTLIVRKSGPRNLQALEKIVTQNGKPDPQEIAVSGAKAEIFHPNTNPPTLTEVDVGKKYRGIEEAAFGIFGGSSRDLQQDYQVSYGGPDSVNGQPATRLMLIPKEPNLAQTFPKVEVWISDTTGVAVQQKLYERGDNNYHLFTYANMKLGPVADSQVKLNLPKNVKREHAR